MLDPQINNKRIINGWALFDWANSSYALVIAVAIFPLYFLSATDDIIVIFGYGFNNSAVYTFSLSFAYILIALVSPILSGIADYSGRKKSFLRFFTTLGSVACFSMFFFHENLTIGWIIGIIAFILSTIGFAGSLVFYNSYLPEIATPDRYDKVSAKGFAYGYVGSVILLITNLIIIKKPEWFGLGLDENQIAVRIAFVMVGMWWFGFAQITFKRLPKGNRVKTNENILSKGYSELLTVWKSLRGMKNLKRFLFAFFCYSAGVQTVLYLASVFADKELNFEESELIIIILILQIVAIGGAYLFAFIAKRYGNKTSLLSMLIIWTGVCFIAYLVSQKTQFFFLAGLVGMVMGGIQSVSRSTYSKLMPADTDDTASYFSFYDALEKLAIVFGTLSFGLIEQFAGGMRNSVLALGLYFIIGLILISKIQIKSQIQSVPYEINEHLY